MTHSNPGCLPACLTDASWAAIEFNIHVFTSDQGHDMVLEAPGEGCILIDGHLLGGGVPFGPGLWQSPDRRWRYRINEQGDLLVQSVHPDQPCHLTILGWVRRWVAPGRAMGIKLEGLGTELAMREAPTG